MLLIPWKHVSGTHRQSTGWAAKVGQTGCSSATVAATEPDPCRHPRRELPRLLMGAGPGRDRYRRHVHHSAPAVEGVARHRAPAGASSTSTTSCGRPMSAAVIDPSWGNPLPLDTPPFPEYTLGHSVQSGAMATVLDGVFGAVSFTDHTHDARVARPGVPVVRGRGVGGRDLEALRGYPLPRSHRARRRPGALPRRPGTRAPTTRVVAPALRDWCQIP
jgi:hypothetical protein